MRPPQASTGSSQCVLLGDGSSECAVLRLVGASLQANNDSLGLINGLLWAKVRLNADHRMPNSFVLKKFIIST